MKKNLRGALLCSLSVTFIYPYAGSLITYDPPKTLPNKRVLVIGDWHKKNDADKRDFKLIKQFIADLNKNKKPICWFHEGNQDIYEEWKYTPEQATITALLCNAFYHNLNMGYVHFDLADMRKDPSRIFTDMLDYCAGSYGDENLAEYYSTASQTEWLAHKLEYVDRMSDDSFASELCADIDCVLQLLKKTQPLVAAPAIRIIELLKTDLIEAKKEIKLFFKQSKGVIRKKLKKAIRNQDLEPLSKLIDTRDAIMRSLADVGFIAHFLENQAHYDTFVFFMGDYHTLIIKEFLEAMGYLKKSELGIWPEEGEEKQPFNSQEITQFFSSFCKSIEK
jgi:hypothetical protein